MFFTFFYSILITKENFSNGGIRMASGLSKTLTAYTSATKKIRKTLDAVIDENSFVELDAFIGGNNELGEFKGEGVLCGFASLGGNDIAVIATNPEVFEGGISKRGAEKIERLVKRAVGTGIPLVSFIDSAGARVLEGIDALYGYGLILSSFAKAYGEVPVFTVNCGKNFGMLSYLSGLSDLCISFERAQTATSSPLLLTASAGDGKDRSTAKALAASTGSITNIVKTTDELKSLLDKAICLYGDCAQSEDDPNRVGKTITAKTNPSVIIEEIFDAGSLLEIRALYAPEVITALASLDGVTVGVVSVKGRLASNGGTKITEFINSISGFNIPVVNIVNCSGIIVDYKQESDSLMRSISDVIYAYANAEIPKIAIITGEAIGAAYSVLAAKGVFDYTFAWDKAHIAPLEGSAAARLLYGKEISKAKDAAEAEKKLAKVYDDENSAMTAAEKGYLDNVIFPDHSRQYLIAALQTMIKR